MYANIHFGNLNWFQYLKTEIANQPPSVRSQPISKAILKPSEMKHTHFFETVTFASSIHLSNNICTLIPLVRWCILIGCRLPGSGLRNQTHRHARLRPAASAPLLRDSAPDLWGKDRIMTMNPKSPNPELLLTPHPYFEAQASSL